PSQHLGGGSDSRPSSGCCGSPRRSAHLDAHPLACPPPGRTRRRQLPLPSAGARDRHVATPPFLHATRFRAEGRRRWERQGLPWIRRRVGRDRLDGGEALLHLAEEGVAAAGETVWWEQDQDREVPVPLAPLVGVAGADVAPHPPAAGDLELGGVVPALGVRVEELAYLSAWCALLAVADRDAIRAAEPERGRAGLGARREVGRGAAGGDHPGRQRQAEPGELDELGLPGRLAILACGEQEEQPGDKAAAHRAGATARPVPAPGRGGPRFGFIAIRRAGGVDRLETHDANVSRRAAASLLGGERGGMERRRPRPLRGTW